MIKIGIIQNKLKLNEEEIKRYKSIQIIEYSIEYRRAVNDIMYDVAIRDGKKDPRGYSIFNERIEEDDNGNLIGYWCCYDSCD